MAAATRAASRCGYLSTHSIPTSLTNSVFCSPDPVRLLTALGADLFAVDHTHCTALHLAAENHNHLAVRHLVKAGAPLLIKNKEVLCVS